MPSLGSYWTRCKGQQTTCSTSSMYVCVGVYLCRARALGQVPRKDRLVTNRMSARAAEHTTHTQYPRTCWTCLR